MRSFEREVLRTPSRRPNEDARRQVTWSTYDTLLRLDFISFAQCCFRELNPRAQFAMKLEIRAR